MVVRTSFRGEVAGMGLVVWDRPWATYIMMVAESGARGESDLGPDKLIL